MANTGKEYEMFVGNLQQALLNAENITTQKNIKVEVDKKITDSCGIDRQFDIYWEYELGGLTYKTVIECKDYASKVSMDKIDALIGKIRDIPDLKAVFATKKGYQSGAKNKAEKNKIDLLIVREQNDTDWTYDDGTPLIKKICINMHLLIPAYIHKFEPVLDSEWIKANNDIATESLINFSGLNNEIFIEDLIENERYSLHELASKLSEQEGKEYGVFKKTVKLEKAFIYHQDIKLKLVGYKIEYSVSKPINELIEMDFSKELVGVVEYLQKGTKKSIFRNGIIK
ncbi:restriction endonuclease [Limnobacter sp. MED105]|uniref:restriction endonuclease n=1 Tax=Limnobacter sp. MED105 TaxID=391597 RepID=UPI00030FB838|nr:restriction endonuclease [Limnobacter sp. MED105]